MTETKVFYPSQHLLGGRVEWTHTAGNEFGPPDGTCCYAPLLSGRSKFDDLDPTTFKTSAGVTIANEIAAGSTLEHAYIRVKGAHSTGLLTYAEFWIVTGFNSYGCTDPTTAIGTCDQTVYGMSVEVDPFHFFLTMEDYRNGNFSSHIDGINGATGIVTAYIDSCELKILYKPPVSGKPQALGDAGEIMRRRFNVRPLPIRHAGLYVTLSPIPRRLIVREPFTFDAFLTVYRLTSQRRTVRIQWFVDGKVRQTAAHTSQDKESFTFEPPKVGHYTIQAKVSDAFGNKADSGVFAFFVGPPDKNVLTSRRARD